MAREKTLLKIIYLTDGRWKFDVKTGMDDDEIRMLLERLKVIENELKGRMKTEIIPMTETVEFITEK
jgi:archaellum component FlaC